MSDFPCNYVKLKYVIKGMIFKLRIIFIIIIILIFFKHGNSFLIVGPGVVDRRRTNPDVYLIIMIVGKTLVKNDEQDIICNIIIM